MIHFPDPIWSNTDFPYMCLKDKKRVEEFRKVLRRVVKPGDVVLDVGAGTGILSFLAVEAGASEVIAVEIDQLLSKCLTESVSANQMVGKIHVINADIMKLELPKPVDIVVAEILDTGLIDELQVPAINRLRDTGIINEDTKVIPASYTTYAQLVNVDQQFYGYTILAPMHEWPFYVDSDSGTGWAESRVVSVSDKQLVNLCNFEQGITDQKVDTVLEFSLNGSTANAVQLSGIVNLINGDNLGATNAMNGDKLIAITPVSGEKVRLRFSYIQGGGLMTLKITQCD